MNVFTVPELGGPVGPTGPTGPTGPASPGQQYGGIALRGDITTGNPAQALIAGFNKIVNFSNNMPSLGVTPQFATSDLVIGTSGDYTVMISMAWQFNALGAMRIFLFVNGAWLLAVTGGDKRFAFTPSNSTAQNIVPLLAGDVLDLRANAGAAGNITVNSAQLYVERANP